MELAEVPIVAADPEDALGDLSNASVHGGETAGERCSRKHQQSEMNAVPSAFNIEYVVKRGSITLRYWLHTKLRQHLAVKHEIA